MNLPVFEREPAGKWVILFCRTGPWRRRQEGLKGTVRTISKIVTGQQAVDGAGVRLVRVIGHGDVADFDPFLMLDAFDATDPKDYVKGFPWHPHRGIETITYLVQGDIEHGDSLGNKGSIRDGDCQWMTAGSGIIHQEMPQASTRMFGLQAWLNLPARDKMTAPKYRGITQADIPVVEEAGVRIHVVAGTYGATSGAMQADFVKALYLDVELAPGASWRLETNPEDTLFVYLMQGAAGFGNTVDQRVPWRHAVLFSEGEAFVVKAGDEGTRFVLMSGTPLREPVAWGGPIVMNTDEELKTAFRELRENTFIK